MNKKENNPLTKKDFEKILSKALGEQAQIIIEAVDFGFEKAKEDRAGMKEDMKEIRNKLPSLERRIIYIEDVMTRHTKEVGGIKATLTRHSKELKEIKKDLKELKAQKEPLEQRVISLEERVEKLEAKMI